MNYGISPQSDREQDRVYQKYYQWVAIFLMLHAVILCIPAYCWKMWERRTMERLIASLSKYIESLHSTHINI